MTCELSRDRVHAWLDGELPTDAALEVERHVPTCPTCAAEYRSARALGEALREGGLAATPPETLEARVRALVVREENGAGRRAPGWAAVAAALVLGGTLGFFAGPGRGGSGGGDVALVEAHVAALARGSVAEIPSSDHHAVKPWFAGRVDVSPKVVDLAGSGFPLVGGRVDRVDGRPVAVLAYTHGRHALDVFVTVARAPAPGVTLTTARGFRIARWTDGDLAYTAVSDTEEKEILRFAELLRR